jgi:hypothetical protein
MGVLLLQRLIPDSSQKLKMKLLVAAEVLKIFGEEFHSQKCASISIYGVTVTVTVTVGFWSSPQKSRCT